MLVVSIATNTMDAREIVRRQMVRDQALKEARLVQLVYRGNAYVKQVEKNHASV
jgi:hypothetical protein